MQTFLLHAKMAIGNLERS